MKVLAVFLLLLVLMNCSGRRSYLKPVNSVPQSNSIGNSKSIQAQERQETKLVPAEFKQIDFQNLKYRYPIARAGGFTLKDGEFRDDTGWISLSSVYFADVTRDNHPEAIVVLSHVSCGASCNGGATLIYVYSIQRGQLRSVWRYETGSLAYGCGLKSLNVRSSIITVELFGKCIGNSNYSPGTSKFLIRDTTRLTFGFNGRKIIETTKNFFEVGERNVLNLETAIIVR